MTPNIEIGDLVIDQNNIFHVLAEKQMIAPLAREVIIDSAIAHIQCTEEEKAMAQQQFFYQMQINPQDTQQLETWLSKNYLTREQLQERILRGIKLEKFKIETWEAQIEPYYLKRKNQLDKVVYSLIRTTKPGEAQELYFRICEGEMDFSEVARQYSQGSEAQTGGLVGPVELNIPHPEITQKLITSEPGKVIPPIRVAEWNIILRLERYITAELDQNLKRRLLDELFNQWLGEEIKNKVHVNLDL